MFRSTIFFSIAITVASAAFGQAELDSFEFPTFSERSTKPSKQSLIVEQEPIRTEANGNKAATRPERARLTSTPAPETNAATPVMAAGFVGYMPFMPSGPTPLLRLMQCQSNNCPDVWAGFEAQHAADNARFCYGKSHGCGCGRCGNGLFAEPCTACEPARGHQPINRYKQSTSNCKTCDSK